MEVIQMSDVSELPTRGNELISMRSSAASTLPKKKKKQTASEENLLQILSSQLIKSSEELFHPACRLPLVESYTALWQNKMTAD